jgi:hypothetical protein
MGGAGGMLWHQHNCGLDDYFCAATAGGSPILDCQNRQEQYFAAGDTMRTMREAFGGVPADGPAVAFQYHRNSVVYLPDTTQCMFYNTLNLPVWMDYGSTALESTAYGLPAETLLVWRQAEGADTTFLYHSGIANHGIWAMPADTICDWLSRFTANRFPDNLSINADTSDDYYWTHASLANDTNQFGRYGAYKNSHDRAIGVNLVRNIDTLWVNFRFPWEAFDSLNCTLVNHDTSFARSCVVLQHIPRPTGIHYIADDNPVWSYHDSSMVISFTAMSLFVVQFEIGPAEPPPPVVPVMLQIAGVYPNPFNSNINLNIESPRAGTAQIMIYDVLGRLADSKSVPVQPGIQRIVYCADNLSTGTYFLQLNNSPTAPVKITLIK